MCQNHLRIVLVRWALFQPLRFVGGDWIGISGNKHWTQLMKLTSLSWCVPHLCRNLESHATLVRRAHGIMDTSSKCVITEQKTPLTVFHRFPSFFGAMRQDQRINSFLACHSLCHVMLQVCHQRTHLGQRMSMKIDAIYCERSPRKRQDHRRSSDSLLDCSCASPCHHAASLQNILVD